MNDDGGLLWDVKEETVTHRLTMPLVNVDMVHRGEIVGMKALNGKTPWVVIKVVRPVLELAVFKENLVIVAALEERGALVVCFFARC